MKIDTLSTFPHMFDSVMNSSMMKRAMDAGILDFTAYDLRDWTHDAHRTTDDYTYGGGSGLVMKCEPIFSAVEDIMSDEQAGGEGAVRIAFMAPHGRIFNDEYASELAECGHILFVCGHYEGIDDRAYSLATDLISLGDYVLTSGELASMVVIDATVRKIPGVLGAKDAAADESFANGLLEYPQYTRPASFRGMDVPEVLTGGNHALIARFRRQQALTRTLRLRPDLLARFLESDSCTVEDLDFLETIV